MKFGLDGKGFEGSDAGSVFNGILGVVVRLGWFVSFERFGLVGIMW